MSKNNGLEAFRRKLARVPKSIRTQVDATNLKSAQEFVANARAAAPKDEHDLARTIRHHATDTGGQIVRAGGDETKVATPSGSYDYARAQEFGTSEHAANPYFFPIYRLFKKRWVSRRSRALNKAFKEFSNGR